MGKRGGRRRRRADLFAATPEAVLAAGTDRAREASFFLDAARSIFSLETIREGLFAHLSFGESPHTFLSAKHGI